MIIVNIAGTKTKSEKNHMAEKGPPVPKIPPVHKTTKNKVTDQAKGKDHS